MGIGDFLSRLFTGKGRDVSELARRLKYKSENLRAVKPSYHEFEIPKRSGGMRKICAPDKQLKALQCTILHRLIGHLKAHPAATGFERGRSIVDNANAHVGKAAVLRMDIKDFFPSTPARRVHDYFRAIGWNRDASRVLVALLTHNGGLPQGAPTSPRLSNLVNHRLDARLAALAKSRGATYTRYADDITFSFDQDDSHRVGKVKHLAGMIIRDEGYQVHTRKKVSIRRRHECQLVTGLVVNTRVSLPRSTRRRLRAIEHHIATNRPSTLTAPQLAGWRSFVSMVEKQRESITASSDVMKSPRPLGEGQG
jgi:RNA-directed DNA polymerase